MVAKFDTGSFMEQPPHALREIDDATKRAIYEAIKPYLVQGNRTLAAGLPVEKAFLINPDANKREIEDLSMRMADAGLGQHKQLRGIIAFDAKTLTRFTVIWPSKYAVHREMSLAILDVLPDDNTSFYSLTFYPRRSSREETADFDESEFAHMYELLRRITKPDPA